MRVVVGTASAEKKHRKRGKIINDDSDPASVVQERTPAADVDFD